MTDLTTAFSALPRGLRQRGINQPAEGHDFTRTIARALSWMWLQWRRREIIRALDKVDDRLLQDVGIERGSIEELVDTLIARWQ
jgi:uncharacterized protein YjiS (DUF1127 family)